MSTLHDSLTFIAVNNVGTKLAEEAAARVASDTSIAATATAAQTAATANTVLTGQLRTDLDGLKATGLASGLLPMFADDVAAQAGGLGFGKYYRLPSGVITQFSTTVFPLPNNPATRNPVFSSNIANAVLGATTLVTVTGLLANETFTWTVYQNNPPNYTFRNDPPVTATANGSGVAVIPAVFVATADRLKLRFTSPTLEVNSVAVTTTNVGGNGGTTTTQRGRPILKDGTVKTERDTLMRGGTMALDELASEATAYTTNRANWTRMRTAGLNLVRVPFSLSLVGVSLNSQLAKMDLVVANAAATGMYVLFMYDWEYGQSNFEEMLSAWPVIAARYKDQTHVFFEMQNEGHWISSHYTSDELDSIAEVYQAMRAAAPNTLIGVLTPASIEPNGGGVISAAQGLVNRGVPIGTSVFVSFHAYADPINTPYNRASVQALKAAFPCLMTETTSGGPNNHSGVDNEVFKIKEMETVGVSWIVLSVRWGDLWNTDSPWSNDQGSFDRIFQDLPAAGVTWTPDPLNTTGGGTGGGGGTPTPTPSTTAFAFRNKLKHGVNFERLRPSYMTYNGGDVKASATYWNYLKTCGITHVRFFMPWHNTVEMGWGTTIAAGTRPTENQVRNFFTAIRACVNAGVVAMLDCIDVCSWDVLEENWSNVSSHLDLCGQIINEFPELTPEMFSVGMYNELIEWQSTQTTYNKIRMDGDAVLRNRLPNHIIQHGGNAWNSRSLLTDRSWQVPSNPLSLARFHGYISATEGLEFWQNIGVEQAEFEARTGIPSWCGELGDDFGHSVATVPGNLARWQTLFTDAANGAPYAKPAYWAVTDGTEFQLSVGGANATLRPEVFNVLNATKTAVTTPIGGPVTPPTNTNQADVTSLTGNVGEAIVGSPVTMTVTAVNTPTVNWVIVAANYVWRGDGTSQVTLNSGGQGTFTWVPVAAGDFVKVWPTAASGRAVDSAAVPQQSTGGGGGGGTTLPTPNTSSYFENFSNNNAGTLTHTWGNRNGISYANGILRCAAIPGAPGNAGACGVMHFPGGANQGFGYGFYEIRSRFFGSGPGPCTLLWAADDSWPRGEEDMGELTDLWYVAHHFDAGGGQNAYEVFTYRDAFPARGDLPRGLWVNVGCLIKPGYLEYFVDVGGGNGYESIGATTNNVTPMYADGGVNRVMGAMHRGDLLDTAVEVDWMRWTTL